MAWFCCYPAFCAHAGRLAMRQAAVRLVKPVLVTVFFVGSRGGTALGFRSCWKREAGGLWRISFQPAER